MSATAQRILIVDDDKDILKALTARLTSAGFLVEACSSAELAAPAAARGLMDLVILDIHMPGYTGPEFHHCLQFAQRARGVPVIYLTGHDTTTNRRTAAEQGAAAFLTKPYDADELIATIRSLIAEANPHRANGHLTPAETPGSPAESNAPWSRAVSATPS